MKSRVERHREQHITQAFNDIIRIIGHPIDTRSQIDDIRRALNNLYNNGAGWGEQDAYSEAVAEAEDRGFKW